MRCAECKRRKQGCSKVRSPLQRVCNRCERFGYECLPGDGRLMMRREFSLSNNNNVHAAKPREARLRPINQSPTSTADHLLPDIRKILISVDPGTAYTKGAYCIFFVKDDHDFRLGQGTLISRLRHVTWPNRTPQVQTQLAYAKTPSSDGTYQQLWGHEVTQALRNREISCADVLRYFKPVIYSKEASARLDMEKLEKQIDQLPRHVQLGRRDESEPDCFRRLNVVDLYSDYLGLVYRYVLKVIKEAYPRLPWPRWDNETKYRDFDPTEYTEIEVVLPLPASTTPEHTEIALTAARRAGLPIPYPVAEPAAAYAFDLQTSFENSEMPLTPGTALVVDLGGGSLDIQAWSVTQTNPLALREEVEGSTDWHGGRFVNYTARELVGNGCQSFMPAIMNALAAADNQMSADEFLDAVEEEFEVQKQSFHGFNNNSSREQVILQIRGLPQLGFSLMRPDQVVLPEREVVEIFAPCIRAIETKIHRIIRDFHQKQIDRHSSENRLRTILLIGGGSASPYMRESFVQTFETIENPAVGYSIPVKIPNDNVALQSTNIALGSLLLLMDKAFIKERLLRRGYCIGLDIELVQGRKYAHGRTQIDPHDGIRREIDVSKFLLPIGEKVGHHHEVIERSGCWWGFFLDKQTELGWPLTQEIFYSDTTSQDGLWLYDKANDIHVAGTLKFMISPADSTEFQVEVSPDGRPYKYAEYAVGLIIEGITMTYKLIIPRSGKFSKGDDPYGPNPIVQLGKLDCAGVFQLFNSAEPAAAARRRA